MSLVHQDLAIDEAESENKPAPLWPDSLRRVKNAKLGEKYSGLVPIREIPSSIGMHLHVVFLLLVLCQGDKSAGFGCFILR